MAHHSIMYMYVHYAIDRLTNLVSWWFAKGQCEKKRALGNKARGYSTLGDRHGDKNNMNPMFFVRVLNTLLNKK